MHNYHTHAQTVHTVLMAIFQVYLGLPLDYPNKDAFLGTSQQKHTGLHVFCIHCDS